MGIHKPPKRGRDITGQLLDGRFLIEKELGRGGMGTVYRAHEPETGKRFAVKVIRRSFATNVTAFARFAREARAMMEVNSPYITRFFELVTPEQGRPFLVMELLEGRLLSSVIREGPVLPKLAVAIAGQMSAGLAMIHDRGMVHRDLKPENVMLVGKEGGGTRAKLLDFGLVKGRDTWEPITRPGLVVGTAYYVAPEQALAEPVSQATDLYTLGCVLFEMLVGWPPFRAESPIDVMTKHVTQPAPLLAQICPRPLPQRLSEVVAKCMEKKPEDRPEDARALQRELALVLHDLKLLASK